MALQTKCQTPGCQFSTEIRDSSISLSVTNLPLSHLDEEGAALLESNLHNAVELVLSIYFVGGESWQNAKKSPVSGT
jgi:hypothetical protein